jgi:hypothetical protein
LGVIGAQPVLLIAPDLDHGLYKKQRHVVKDCISRRYYWVEPPLQEPGDKRCLEGEAVAYTGIAREHQGTTVIP